MPTSTTRDRILDAAERLVLQRGFAGMTVDAVIEAAPTSKGSFFHHFASKDDLGRALVDRYARTDADALDTFLRAAEEETDDPAEQLVAFIRLFEEAAEGLTLQQPGCLFVSFLYARDQVDPRTHQIIVESIELWRSRVSSRLRMAARFHPPAVDVDLTSLADHVFTVFEGGFILARATGDSGALGAQLAHLRRYLALLFDVDPVGRPT